MFYPREKIEIDPRSRVSYEIFVPVQNIKCDDEVYSGGYTVYKDLSPIHVSDNCLIIEKNQVIFNLEDFVERLPFLDFCREGFLSIQLNVEVRNGLESYMLNKDRFYNINKTFPLEIS